MKVKVWNFTVFERVYIKQIQFFPSNDNQILTLAFKIAYLFSDTCQALTNLKCPNRCISTLQV